MRALAAIAGLLAILQQQGGLRVDVQLQEIVATVRDDSGRLVKNLRPEDFILEEDGVRQQIAHLVQDTDLPVSLGILIDTSGSMSARQGGPSRLEAAVGTARVLLHSMKPRDEFALMSFSSAFEVKQKFTQDIARVESELIRFKSSGATNLFDAVGDALKEIQRARYRKRALIVITDAQAQGDLAKLRADINAAEVLIYTFAMREFSSDPVGATLRQNQAASPAPQSMDELVLEALATGSGGRSVAFGMQSDEIIERMLAFVQDIAAELRGQYTIGYYPVNPGVISNRVIRLRTTSSTYRVRIRRDVLGENAGVR